jgi:UDP-N-acetylmuramate dehydrogenase
MTAPLPHCVVSHQHVGSTTYYGIGGVAEYYSQPRSVAELQHAIRWAKAQELPIAVLGCGSNALVSDGHLNALVICLSELKVCFWENDSVLYAEAGVSNTEIAEVCLDAGRNGATWMYRMPGHLGATVRMNARCFGGEISQIAVDIFTIDTHGKLKIHSGTDVFHGYKKTSLMDSPEVVVAARLKLNATSERADLLSHMLHCENERLAKHHFDFPSCGSTFKNNYSVGKPSGQVFDACGLKGHKVGQSQVSQYHANFVWNLGGTTAASMLTLAAHMRECALTQQNADLELEVQPIGLFPNEHFTSCAMTRLGPSVPVDRQHWVGLLWHPTQQLAPNFFEIQAKTSGSDELLLFEAPFLHYYRMPGRGRPELSVRLVQLRSLEEARKNPSLPFLRWETVLAHESDNWESIFQLRPEQPAGFVDELWNFSVSELFFGSGDPNSTHYLEFECTPDGHWVALAFDAPRVRTALSLHPRSELWSDITLERQGDCLSVTFSYATVKSVIHNSLIKIQACLSLGNDGWYLAPHWSPSGSAECWDTQDKPDVKPDFHQPHRFWDIALW